MYWEFHHASCFKSPWPRLLLLLIFIQHVLLVICKTDQNSFAGRCGGALILNYEIIFWSSPSDQSMLWFNNCLTKPCFRGSSLSVQLVKSVYSVVIARYWFEINSFMLCNDQTGGQCICYWFIKQSCLQQYLDIEETGRCSWLLKNRKLDLNFKWRWLQS